jgi:hypothetical protein
MLTNLIARVKALPAQIQNLLAWLSDGPGKRGVVAAIAWLLCRHFGADYIDRETVDEVFGAIMAALTAMWSHTTFTKVTA